MCRDFAVWVALIICVTAILLAYNAEHFYVSDYKSNHKYFVDLQSFGK